MSSKKSDVVVVGAGAVGLSIAWELSRAGMSVTVVDAFGIGKKTSWAGAGILPPVPDLDHCEEPLDFLGFHSRNLHRVWASDLLETTGIDTGYRDCGGLYLARQKGDATSLQFTIADWKQKGITVNEIREGHLSEFCSGLTSEPFRSRYFLPDESQLRNPRHLQALTKACLNLGVEIIYPVQVDSIPNESHPSELKTSAGNFSADYFCFCAGSWTKFICEQLQVNIEVYPVRGQMLLYKFDRQPFTQVINEGPRYLVPREDGYLLVGSTEEEVGFVEETSPEGLEQLRSFGESIFPSLKDKRPEKSWAGLRPATLDGHPYIGKVPGKENVFIAAGHFRSGLFYSPATAVLIRQMIQREPTLIDLSAFRLQRGGRR